MKKERIYLHGTESVSYKAIKQLIEDDFGRPCVDCHPCECECKSAPGLLCPSLDDLLELDMDIECAGEELIIVMKDGRVGVYMFDQYSDFKESFFDSFKEFANHVYLGENAERYCRDTYFERDEITEIIMSEFPNVEEVLVGEL